MISLPKPYTFQRKSRFYKDTPVHVVEHRLEGDGLICPECGETMVEIGKEVRRTLVIKKPEITI